MHLPAHTHTIVHCFLCIGGLIGVGPIGRPGEPELRGPSGSRGSKGDPGDPGIVLSACSTYQQRLQYTNSSESIGTRDGDNDMFHNQCEAK